MPNIYNKYFAKDKALRHYTQHLLLALFGFVLLSLYFGMFSFSYLILFLLFSFIIDLDNVLILLFSKNRYSEFRRDILSAIKRKDFKLLAEISTKNHKILNNLILHNVVGYFIVTVTLAFALLGDYNILIVIFSALFIHMTFDILDDTKQLGNIKNWLWPLNKLLKK